MKSRNLILAAMLMAMPSTIMAQQNIKKAFDALLNEKITENKTQHVLEEDSETGRLKAMCDVYDFTISTSSALERLKEARKAFDKDLKDAYSVNTALRDKDGDDVEKGSFASLFESIGFAPVTLYVGDGSYSSVAIGSMKGSEYIYACFADKTDPDRRYRYAYAMEWVEKGKKTKVRLAITYALRPEARNNKKISKTRVIVNGTELPNTDADGNSSGLKTSESWLSEFNNYKRLFLKNPDGNTATHCATSIYGLCKKSDMLEPEEKQIVISELTKLKDKSTDELIQNVFEMSIKKLK